MVPLGSLLIIVTAYNWMYKANDNLKACYSTTLQKVNGYFDSVWLPQFHALLYLHNKVLHQVLSSSAFTNHGSRKCIEVVYNLECKAAS